jgi:MFS transporter, Spinster family, sphingosine-1-phosphate transporter
MKKGRNTKRIIFVLLFLFFLLFHQLDVFLLRPINKQMISILHGSEVWLEPMVTISIGVSILFALFWGVLFDRHSRVKILALVSFLWGVSSWLVGISPTLGTYIISGAAGGIDNLTASGMFSIVGDLFGSKHRGKIIGLLWVSQPMSLFLVAFIDTWMPIKFSWRLLLLAMGGIAFLFTVLINFFLHEPQRGAKERGLTDVQLRGTYLFDWETAKENLNAPSIILVFFSSFLCAFPWFILTTWIPPHFQELHQVSSGEVVQRLMPALIAVMIGYPAGGFLGDLYAKKRDTGRVTMVVLGLLLPALCLFLAFMIDDLTSSYYLLLLILMGFFMSFSWPNLIAVVFDVSVPEVRSFVTAILLGLQALSGLITPALIPLLQIRLGLRTTILSLSIGAWLVGLLVTCGLFFTLPHDIENLRRHMAYRSHLERRLAKSKSH